MEFDLKWVHMARQELILRLDGALWLRIIFSTPPDPKKVYTSQKNAQQYVKAARSAALNL